MASLLLSDCMCMGFWPLYSVPLIYVSALMPIPHHFDYGNLVIQFEIRDHDTSNFVLPSQDCCGYLGSFISTQILGLVVLFT